MAGLLQYLRGQAESAILGDEGARRLEEVRDRAQAAKMNSPIGRMSNNLDRYAAGVLAMPVTLPVDGLSMVSDVSKLVDAGTAMAAEKGYMSSGTNLHDALPNLGIDKYVSPLGVSAQRATNDIVGLKSDAKDVDEIVAQTAGQVTGNPLRGARSIIAKVTRLLSAAPESVPGKALVAGAAGGLTAAADALINDAEAAAPFNPATDALTLDAGKPAASVDVPFNPATDLLEVSEPAITPFTGEIDIELATLQDKSDFAGMFMDNWKSAVAIGAAVVGGLAIRKGLQLRPALEALDQATSMAPKAVDGVADAAAAVPDVGTVGAGIGTNTIPKYNSPGVDIAAGLVDTNIRLTDIVDKTLGINDPVASQVIADSISRVGSPLSTAETTMFVLDTGKLPGTNIETVPFRTFANTLEAVGKRAPDDRALYERASVHADELEARAQGIKSPELGTDAQLQASVNAMLANPNAKMLFDQQRTMMNAMLDWHFQRGTLTPTKYNELRTKQQSYLPRETSDVPASMKFDRSDLLGSAKSVGARVADVLNGNKLSDDGGQKLGALFDRTGRAPGQNILPPLAAMEQYIAKSIRYAEVNEVRNSVIDSVMHSVKLDKKVKLPTGLSKPHQFDGLFTIEKAPSSNTITTRVNGVERHIGVGDPAILQSLKFAPKLTFPLFNAQRKVMSTGTTGVAAPFQAIKSFLYDATLSGSMTPKGFKHSFVGAPINDGVSGMLHGIRGLSYGLAGDLARASANSLERSFLNDGFLAGFLKQVGVDPAKLARRGAEAYANSIVSIFREAGLSGAGRFDKDAQLLVATTMNQLAPGANNGRVTASGIKIYNAYTSLLEGMNSATRLSFFAKNYKEGMTKGEMNKLVKATNELMGDYRKRGDSNQWFVAGVREAMPYGNVTIQSLAQLAKMIRTQPERTIPGLIVGGAVPAIAVLTAAYYTGPDAVRRLFDEYTSGQRTGAAVIFARNEDGSLTEVPINLDPVTRIPYSMMLHLLAPFANHDVNNETGVGDQIIDTLHSYITDLGDSTTSAYQDMKAAVISNVLPGVPPIAGALAGAAGLTVRLDEPQEAFQKLSTAKLTGEEGLTAPLPADATYLERKLFDANIQAMLTSMLGAVTAQTMGSVQELWRGLTNDRSTAESFGNAAVTYLDAATRNSPLSPLLGFGQRLSTQNAVGSQLGDTLSKMEQNIIEYNANNDGSYNVVGNKAQAQATDVARGIADPRLHKAYQAMLQTDKELSRSHGPVATLKLKQQQLEALMARPTISPAERAEQRNELVTEIQNIQGRVLNMILQSESRISQVYGVPIEFKKLNRRATLDDFAQ